MTATAPAMPRPSPSRAPAYPAILRTIDAVDPAPESLRAIRARRFDELLAAAAEWGWQIVVAGPRIGPRAREIAERSPLAQVGEIAPVAAPGGPQNFRTIAADLAEDDLRWALAKAGIDQELPIAVFLEGVVQALTPIRARALCRGGGWGASPLNRVTLDFWTPKRTAALSRLAAEAGRPAPPPSAFPAERAAIGAAFGAGPKALVSLESLDEAAARYGAAPAADPLGGGWMIAAARGRPAAPAVQ